MTATPSTRRFLLPALAVALIATYFCFFRLSADRLGLDEGNYAAATRNLLGSDDWLTVTPYAGHTYFQKPPLYMWLSAPLVAGNPDELWRYRAWSALFGVVAIVATACVGNALAGRTVGIAAGLLLATNGDFLLYHGARDGTMDAGLTCFTILVVALACFRTPSPAWRWALVGLCCGIMSMLKPFVGLPLLAIVAMAALASERSATLPRHLLRVALAIIVMLGVALPWYVACTRRYGQRFLDEIIGQNVVGRIVEGNSGNVQGPFFYVNAILSASPFFLLAFPAIAYGIWVARRGDRRWWIVVVVGAGLPVLYSLSKAKVTHYLYPAFPSLCILIALLIAHGLRAALVRLARPDWVRPAITTLFLTAVLVQGIALYLHTAGQRQYRPWELFHSLRPAISTGRVSVAFVGFPDDAIEWRARLRLEADDIFWLTAIRQQATSRTLPPAAAGPTYVLTNRMALPTADLDTLLRSADASLRHEDSQIVAAVTGADALLRPAAAAVAGSSVRIVNPDGRFTDTIRCAVGLPLPRRAVLHVEFAADGDAANAEIGYRATMGGRRIGRGLASPTLAGRLVSVPLDDVRPSDVPAEVTITLAPSPTGGRVLSAWLSLDP